MPAPSPITKPSRVRSKGRDARAGVSLKPVDKVFAAAKAPRLTRSIAASAPPHTAMSASPQRISRAASPMAWRLAAQAVTGAPIGPFRPCLIDTWPAARLTRNEGIVNGDRRFGPRISVVRTAPAIAGNPPMPDAMTVAVRRWDTSSAGAHCACASASCAAASAKAMKRSILRWSLVDTKRSMSKPPHSSSCTSGTTPPTRAAMSAVIASGSRRKPDWPASSRCHTSSTPQPSGETIPMPVTTIRRFAVGVMCMDSVLVDLLMMIAIIQY